jgi:hypothetical protein
MMNTTFDTIAIPRLTTTTVDAGILVGTTGRDDATRTIAQAMKVPLRVLVRNISFAADALLTFEPGALQQLPTRSQTYRLPAGAADTFMIAPGQKITATSPSDECELSISVSEALPELPSTK